jgi:hypothetical protein
MKQLFVAAALAAAALSPSLARAFNVDNPVHPLVGIALTGGGDKLSSIEFTNGHSDSVRAGGLVQVYGGVEVREKDSPVAFQATIGYHVDRASARNGEQRFERFPIEAIALLNAAPNFRVGLGARYAMAAKFHSDGAGYVGNGDFKSQLGGLVMAEWLFRPSMGLQVRFVSEKYKLKGVDDSVHVDGNHGGVGFNYYF